MHDYIHLIKILEKIDKKIELIDAFSKILIEENKKVSLISRKDIESKFECQILHTTRINDSKII